MLEKIKEFFFKLLNIGTSDSLSAVKIKRIRIVNGLSIIAGFAMFLAGIVVYFSFVDELPDNLSSFFDLIVATGQEKVELSEKWTILFPLIDLFMAVVATVVVFLNYKKRYNLARFIACLLPIFFTFTQSIFIGLRVSYFLLLSSVFAIMLYRTTWKYVLFWALNLLLFVFIAIYIHNFGEIFSTPKEQELSSVLINMINSFFILFLIINSFKKENLRNEEVLVEKNAMLSSQKNEISAQRDELHFKNEEISKQQDKIISSIQYAKKIQTAILPENILDKNNIENFILFRPRDIVSGDFYWMKSFEDKTVIAVADCTGHGVPGAFMSMLGISFLNEIVTKNNISNSGAILNELREKIKRALRQKGNIDEQKDGMDLALCIIDSKNMEMQFSGAYNSLYLIRSKQSIADNKISLGVGKHTLVTANQLELYDIKGDRQPIAIHIEETLFSTQKINIVKGDLIYVFTDGFVDQLGGEHYQKYYSKNFKKMLLSICEKPMNEQHKILDDEIENWIGKNEQVDDILLVGIRI
ncbi:MAG: SpoIIE family protein phosphatase [Bacteroidales bacterium]|nr:SpoIIE family protein phosphatase [Bacteroidales bacterium]